MNRRSFIAAATAVLSTTAAFGFDDHEAESYTIYSLLLNAQIAVERLQPYDSLLISDITYLPAAPILVTGKDAPSGVYNTSEGIFCVLTPDRIAALASTVADYQQQRPAPQRFEQKFHITRNYVLFDVLHKQQHNFVYFLSPILFDSNRTIALAYLRYIKSCQMEAAWHLFENRSGSWQKVNWIASGQYGCS